MSQEKDQEQPQEQAKPEEPQQEKPQEQAKPEEPQQEKPQEQAKEDQQKEDKPQKVEIPKNCGSCKKPIGKIRYYRNMQFFCNRKCWAKFKQKQAAAKQKEEAEAKK